MLYKIGPRGRKMNNADRKCKPETPRDIIDRSLGFIRSKLGAELILLVCKPTSYIVAYSLKHPLNGMTLIKMEGIVSSLLGVKINGIEPLSVKINLVEPPIFFNEILIELPLISSGHAIITKVWVVNTFLNTKLFIIKPDINYSELNEKHNKIIRIINETIKSDRSLLLVNK